MQTNQDWKDLMFLGHIVLPYKVVVEYLEAIEWKSKLPLNTFKYRYTWVEKAII